MEVVVEKCGCGVVVASNEGHEVKGEVLCFDCYGDVMDEGLFGDPFGEW